MGVRKKYRKYREITPIIQRENKSRAKKYSNLEYFLLKLNIIILEVEYFNEYFDIILIIIIFIDVLPQYLFIAFNKLIIYNSKHALEFNI